MKSNLFVLSALLGGAVAYLIFVLFLQTEAVSTARLLLAVVLFAGCAAAHYWIIGRWFLMRLMAPAAVRLVGMLLLIVAVFFPFLYRPPSYPTSPLLRPWADIAVQFQVPAGAEPLMISRDSVRLVMGREAVDSGAFQLAGPWQASGGLLKLAPGATASLRWTGTLPETTTLSVQPTGTDANLTIYWDSTRTTEDLRAGRQAPVQVSEKAPLPWGYNLAFALSCFIVSAWLLAVVAILAGTRLAFLGELADRRGFAWAVLALAVLLTALTVKLQLNSLDGGLQFLTTTQLARHNAVLQGQAPDPWQYRVMSEYTAEAILRLYQLARLPGAVPAAFLSLRVLQNLAIFLVAFAVYKRLTASNWLGVLGILALAGSMANAFYDNDLSFNTYFDLLFYLLAALLLLRRNYGAVVILTVIAALNRETSGLIPLMMAGTIYGDNTRPGLKKYAPALVSIAMFGAVFVGLHLLFPHRPLYVPYKHAPGIPLLLYNLTRSFTWQQLLTTLGLVPLLGLAFYSRWPALWQRLFVLVCPIWFLVHSFASVMAETRLFLVPQAVIFVPGVLFAIRASLETRERSATSSLQASFGAS